jgi:triacylglycerol lipase
MKRLRRIVAMAAAAVAVAGVLVAQSPPAAAASPFPNGKNPVVLVHGFTEDGSMWTDLQQSLIQSGYTSGQITALTYDTYSQSNVVTADVIGKTVQNILTSTGADKVDIISHSMGGLNSRYCVKFAGCAGHTDHWISLAGANKGTTTANYCSYLVTCQEMIPGSAVLTKLNAAPLLPAGTKWSTLWTPNDGVIVPAQNTVLEGADNIQVSPFLNHLTIFRDPGVIATVKSLLDS